MASSPTRDELATVIRDACYPLVGRVVDVFTRYFRARFGGALVAVIAYGSRLSEMTASATSIHDFYLVCRGYRSFYGPGSRFHATLNGILPPNIYELAVDDPALGRLRCKYCVISMRDLERETGPAARDLYHLGRFSKRMGIAWVAGPRTLARLIEVLLGATERVGAIALPRLRSPFTVEQLSLELLGLSYLADRRVEAGDKVAKLHRSEAPYYARLHRLLLEMWAAAGDRHVARDSADDAGEGRYRFLLPEGARRRAVNEGERLLAASRLRGQLRWPKYLFTFESWVDYMLEKIVRAKGVEIRLTEAERRHPLIAAARYYWRLRKSGALA